MRVQRITERFAIADQPGPDDWAAIRAAGFVAAVNNRVDGEDGCSVSADRARAEREGLGFTHIPVAPGPLRLDDVRRFGAALTDANGPVLAHCRVGARSLALWAASEVLEGRLDAGGLDALEARTRLSLDGVRRFAGANGGTGDEPGR